MRELTKPNIRALFEGVAALCGKGMVDLVCDSDHVLDGLKSKLWKITEPVEYLERWQQLVGTGDQPGPIENCDLWRRLDELRAGSVGIMPAFQRIAHRSRPEQESADGSPTPRAALAG